jgi:SAM-dependent methyltransferase
LRNAATSRKKSKSPPPPAEHLHPVAVSEFFREPLVDMGTLDTPEMAGIYTPESEIGQAKIGISNFFLEDASVYHEKYSNTGYFKTLLTTALSHLAEVTGSPRILDIGSGSGNTVFPCLELFPDCRIVATDLSPNLLKILLEHAEKHASAAGRLYPVCMDATRDYYQPQSFDLVIGAAILHHLIDPGAAIRAAGRALRPGGHAIFFEPFESGSSILRLAYSEILARNAEHQRIAPSERLALTAPQRFVDRLFGLPPSSQVRPPPMLPETRRMLRYMIDEWELRTGSDKSSPIFEIVDDKWLFTRTYLEPLAKAAGFDEMIVYPILDVENQFVRQTEVFLQLGIGQPPSALPDWAWHILEGYDRKFSLDLKRELIIEGAIILTKG